VSLLVQLHRHIDGSLDIAIPGCRRIFDVGEQIRLAIARLRGVREELGEILRLRVRSKTSLSLIELLIVVDLVSAGVRQVSSVADTLGVRSADIIHIGDVGHVVEVVG
jgi:hypothetical protein